MPEQRPVVGVGVMIVKDGKVLLGKRLCEPGRGNYQFPGGHLENMESFEACARRESLEECGLEIQNVSFRFIRNQKEYAPKHFVMVMLSAEWKGGDPRTLEPEKCEPWDWYDIDDVPQPCLETTRLAIEGLKTGEVFFDA